MIFCGHDVSLLSRQPMELCQTHPKFEKWRVECSVCALSYT